MTLQHNTASSLACDHCRVPAAADGSDAQAAARRAAEAWLPTANAAADSDSATNVSTCEGGAKGGTGKTGKCCCRMPKVQAKRTGQQALAAYSNFVTKVSTCEG